MRFCNSEHIFKVVVGRIYFIYAVGNKRMGVKLGR